LDEIDPDWASSEEAKRHVPELVSAFLRANDWGMRWDIAEVLGDIGDKRAVKALAWAIKHDNEYVQYAAKIALEKIKEAHGKD
jgi:HEAT repeat protein